jgi:2-C-methyl-D-erythritol 4-phosphate cytidylyltransferase
MGGGHTQVFMPVDTLKMVDRDGFVGITLDRTSIISVQTPQIFAYADLKLAYREAALERIQRH